MEVEYAKSIQRLPESEKWRPDILGNLKATPQRLSVAGDPRISLRLAERRPAERDEGMRRVPKRIFWKHRDFVTSKGGDGHMHEWMPAL